MTTATGSEVRPAGRGRVKDPAHDKRLAKNRARSGAQRAVLDDSTRLAHNPQACGEACDGTGFGASPLSQPERIATTVSAYLDGRMSRKARTAFEAMLSRDQSLLREVAEYRWVDRQLAEIGAEILTEPVPDFLLEAVSHLPPE